MSFIQKSIMQLRERNPYRTKMGHKGTNHCLKFMSMELVQLQPAISVSLVVAFLKPVNSFLKNLFCHNFCTRGKNDGISMCIVWVLSWERNPLTISVSTGWFLKIFSFIQEKKVFSTKYKKYVPPYHHWIWSAYKNPLKSNINSALQFVTAVFNCN